MPLDGSGDWEYLLPHLERLVRPGGSEVTVLEAVPFLETLLEMPMALGGMELGACGDLDVAERYVAAVVGLLRSRGIPARGMTEIGSGAGSLADVAHRIEATLVALSIREPAGLLHSWRRTPAEHALLACPTPMYVIPAQDHGGGEPFPPAGFERVIVPVDGSVASLEVIPAAAAICRRFQAPLLFLHVVPSRLEAWQARAVFQSALRRADGERIPAETLLGKGDPASEILRICKDLGGSLIAMRTHLREDEGAGVLGSVTVRVLRAAAVPLLVVRSRAESSPSGVGIRFTDKKATR